ncbi:MAG TPA: SurA N-terminal domain-containing protein, partial [Chloroflexia bacterium]|nr:SurA N-terminal domain-containing protein [Chloroflexia bacterium]
SFDKRSGFDDEEEYTPDPEPRVRSARGRDRVPAPAPVDYEDEEQGELDDPEWVAEEAEAEEQAPAPAPRPRSRPAAAAAPGARPTRLARPAAAPGPPGRRGVQVAAAGSRGLPIVPMALGLVVMLILGGAYLVFGNSSPAQAPADPNVVAATVNGKVIPRATYEERWAAAKQDYIDQFQLNFDAPDGSGERMADVLGFDVLDQMINFEVLLQEAKKQQIVPNPTQVEERYQQARAAAARDNLSWEDFIQTQGAHSDAEFRQNVVEALTYLIISSQHAPKDGTDAEKEAAFGRYICDTRTKYDVKIYVKFIVPQTPCSSATGGGAAADQPLGGATLAPRTPAPTSPPAPPEVPTAGPPALTPPK